MWSWCKMSLFRTRFENSLKKAHQLKHQPSFNALLLLGQAGPPPARPTRESILYHQPWYHQHTPRSAHQPAVAWGHPGQHCHFQTQHGVSCTARGRCKTKRNICCKNWHPWESSAPRNTDRLPFSSAQYLHPCEPLSECSGRVRPGSCRGTQGVPDCRLGSRSKIFPKDSQSSQARVSHSLHKVAWGIPLPSSLPVSVWEHKCGSDLDSVREISAKEPAKCSPACG